jgi:hypothetical protein
MTTVTRVKKCDCDSTSSGPRVVIVEEKMSDSVYVATMQMVEFACDKCNTPWQTEVSD